MMNPLGSRAHAVALLLAVPALGLLSGDPRAATALLTAALTAAQTDARTESFADPTAPLLAVIALVAWACAGWLLLIAGLVGLGRLEGRIGSVAHRLGSWVAPVSVRALVGLAVGVTVSATVLAGPALAGEPTPAPSTSSTAAAAAPLAASPSLDWPTAAPAATPTAAPVASTTSSPVASPTAAPASSPAASPTAVERELPRDVVPASSVVVQAGDSLWAIAARDLGTSATPARIAQAWPQWWQANRAVLGADPDLIHPGTPLADPTR